MFFVLKMAVEKPTIFDRCPSDFVWLMVRLELAYEFAKEFKLVRIPLQRLEVLEVVVGHRFCFLELQICLGLGSDDRWWLTSLGL